MASQTEFDFTPPPADMKARQHLAKLLNAGEAAQANLIRAINERIIEDKYVRANAVRFELNANGRVRYLCDGTSYTMHSNAFQQLCNVCSTRLHGWAVQATAEEDWGSELVCDVLNRYFQLKTFAKNDPPGNTYFLQRAVNGQVRGFLSRNYNTRLSSKVLLQAFVMSCLQMGARPFSVTITDLEYGISMFRPEVYEPIPGECIAVGAWWSKSDFGKGALKLSNVVMRVKDANVMTGESWFKRRHIGKRAQIDVGSVGRVVEDIALSDEAAEAACKAQALAIRDVVHRGLSDAAVDAVVEAVRLAMQDEHTWAKLDNRLRDVLTKSQRERVKDILDQEQPAVIDVPVHRDDAGNPRPSSYWAANMLAWFSENEVDPQKKADLQAAAGSFLF